MAKTKTAPARLQKVLANAGLGSRRALENLVKQGKILVNGKVATLGQLITVRDKVQIDGKMVDLQEAPEQLPRVLMYHKKEGEICSRVTDEDKPSVFNHLPPLASGRWVMVGRLDVNTSGLLLFTNNGELAHQLMHPRFKMERQYAVRVLGDVTDQMIARLKKGVMLEQGKCRFTDVIPQGGSGANQWFTVSLSEGKYREVRNLWASQGCMVSRLIRIKYGKISLPRDLKKGQWRELPTQQVQALMTKLDP